jgi:hypothetical protein
MAHGQYKAQEGQPEEGRRQSQDQEQKEHQEQLI